MTDDAEIVEMLRALGSALHAAEVAPDDRAELLRHLRAAHDLTGGGPQRLRWYEVDATEVDATRARNRELSTFSGAVNAIAPPMKVSSGTLADGRPALIGRVRLDRLREGPPRAAHGGVLAGLFDELLGGGQRLSGGPPGVTGRLTVRYRRPTPLDADLELRVWVHDERKRRVVVRGECVVIDSDGPGDGETAAPVTAEAEAIFLRVDFRGLDAMMQGRSDGATPSPAPAPEPT